MSEGPDTRQKVLKVLTAIPQGVRYSTTDWQRILGDDKRRIRHTLDALEAENVVEKESDEGRPDKPLYKLKET